MVFTHFRITYTDKPKEDLGHLNLVETMVMGKTQTTPRKDQKYIICCSLYSGLWMPFIVTWSSVLNHLLTTTLKDGSYLDTWGFLSNLTITCSGQIYSCTVMGLMGALTSIFDKTETMYSVKMQFSSGRNLTDRVIGWISDWDLHNLL